MENLFMRIYSKQSLKTGVFAENQLMNLYSKAWGYCCMRNDYLDRIPEQYLVCWNVIIMGYAQNEHAMEAFKVLGQMLMEQVCPNQFTFVVL